MSSFRKLSHALLGATVILLSGFAIVIVAGYVWSGVQLERSKEQLPVSKVQWTRAGISYYQVHVEFDQLWSLPGFLDPDAIYLCGLISDTLTVKDEQVVAARELTLCANIFNRLTVDGAFVLAEQHLAAQEPTIDTLQFDPKNGYITWLVLRYASGGHPISLHYSGLVVLDN